MRNPDRRNRKIALLLKALILFCLGMLAINLVGLLL